MFAIILLAAFFADPIAVSGDRFPVEFAVENRISTDARAESRSPLWTAVRNRFIKANPSCVCCGRKAEEVHHLKPFHLGGPELDPSNLRSLCRDCHFAFGHLWNFKNENPDLDFHASILLKAKTAADERRKLELKSESTKYGLQSFVVTNRIINEAASAPTPMAEVVRVLALLPTPEVGFVDFGCGDARWCIAAAERWPKVRVTGVEINPARASAARERVRMSGLVDRITIVTGDATTVDVKADVGSAYLYSDVLDKMNPRISRMRGFASYMHKPSGLPFTKSGDSWIYIKASPVAEVRGRVAEWNGSLYSQAQCNDPRCQMCNSIRSQLAVPLESKPAVKRSSGHYVRVCDGRRCWNQWVED